MRILSLGLIVMASMMMAACSTTPDRYAFWRDNSSDAVEASAKKPNLGDIPASPSVTDARQEMKDMQSKLAADRQAAYTQAQADKGAATTAFNDMTSTNPGLSAITTSGIKPMPAIPNDKVNTNALPFPSDKAVGAPKNTGIAETNLPPISPTGINNMATAGVTPSIINPNRTSDNNPLPVYTGSNVQINHAATPTPVQGSVQDYVYGSSNVQFRNTGNAAPGTAEAASNDNVMVDMSALGGAAPGGPGRGGFARGKPSAPAFGNRPPFGAMLRQPMAPGFAASGSPTIYFNHGSARLSPQDKKTLSAIVNAAQQGRTVKVVGHASKRADTKSTLAAKEANLKISATRATAVMKELAKNGVNAKKIKPIAVGDSDAKQAGSEKAARRVDIIVE